MIGTRVLTLR